MVTILEKEDMSTEELLAEIISQVGEFLSDEYNVDLDIPITINGRLTSTLGRFRYNRHEAVGIELSKNLITYNDISSIMSVALHEAVHYALYELGLPNSDGHPVFENELKKHSIVSNYNKNTNLKFLTLKTMVLYKCGCEDNIHTRQKALLKKYRYHCTKCGEDLEFYKKEKMVREFYM